MKEGIYLPFDTNNNLDSEIAIINFGKISRKIYICELTARLWKFIFIV